LGIVLPEIHLFLDAMRDRAAYTDAINAHVTTRGEEPYMMLEWCNPAVLE
jgi:hypothetical protein